MDKVELQLKDKPIHPRQPVSIGKKFFGPQRGMNLQEYMVTKIAQGLCASKDGMKADENIIANRAVRITNAILEQLK